MFGFVYDGIEFEIFSNSKKQVWVTGLGSLLSKSKNVEIPDKVYYTGEWFSVTGIADEAFKNNKYLINITLPNSLQSIGDWAFVGCYKLRKVEVPSSVTNIGGYAFSDCMALEQFTFPESLTEISNGMFLYCYALKELAIPNSVVSIGNEAFRFCGFEQIVLPEKLKAIGDEAFGNTSIKELIIPNSVTSIGEDAFYSNKIETVVSLAVEPPTCHGTAFQSEVYAHGTLYVPEGSVEKYKVAEGWKNFYNIEVAEVDDVVLDPKSAVCIVPVEGGFKIESGDVVPVEVYSIDGRLNCRYGEYRGEVISLPKGFYVLKISGRSEKIKI